jgi:23S rRNA (cytosine1962-C5)-methyltransferase
MQSSIPTVQLVRGKAKPFWLGHPWIFPGAIQSISHEPAPGEWVHVVDHQQQSLGYGVFNPHSLYRVRLLTSPYSTTSTLEETLQQHIKAAYHRRQLLSLPSSQTTGYRLINSEGDFLSGLTVDIFAEHAVIAPSAYWVMLQLPLIQAIIQQQFPELTLHVRPTFSALKQDGWHNATSAEHTAAQTIIKENDISYHIALDASQKTGFYLDQRDNRALVQQLARGKRVLDLFCYTGGFALNAAQGGATEVIGIDSSATAIETARANATLNHLDIEFIEDDAFVALEAQKPADFIILDPPKISPSRRDADRALRYQTRLHELALQKLNPGGLLLSCSCSASLPALALARSLQEAACATQQSLTVLTHTRAGLDHPVLPALIETNDYLQAVLLMNER